MSIEVIIGIMIFIIGMIFGSFYNVVGYRVPKNMSIAFPSSHCVNCGHKLKFYENIPILSYIFLLGKCSKCKKRISIFYPFFEALTGILFLISYLIFGLNIKFFISITFVSILIIISISDLKYFIIPDEVLIAGIILIVIELLVNCYLNDINIIKGVVTPITNGILSFVGLYLFKLIGDLLFKKESLGGGDIKLMFLIGLTIGFDMSIVTLFLSSFIALPISVVCLIKNDSNILPFGPYLSISALILFFSQINLEQILDIFTG